MKTLENQREQTIASERYCPVLSTEYHELFRALTNRLKDTLPMNRTRIIGEELNRVAGFVEEKDLECKKYMAALSVLVDLSLQGWVFDFQDNQLTLKMENNSIFASNALYEAGIPFEINGLDKIFARIEGKDYIPVVPIYESTFFGDCIHLPKGDAEALVAKETIWEFDEYKLKNSID